MPSPMHSPTIRPISASLDSDPSEDGVSTCGAARVGKAVGVVGEKVGETVGGVVGEKVGVTQQPSEQHTAPWTQQLPKQQTSPGRQQPRSQQVLPSEQAVVPSSQHTSLTPSKQPDVQQVAVPGAASQQGFELPSQQLLVLLEHTVVPQVTVCSSLLLLPKNPYGFA